MVKSIGKKFEERFVMDWERSFPNTFFHRIPDQVTRYKGSSSNMSDFIAFMQGKLYLLECKETQENTFSFSKLPQYDILKSFLGLQGIRIGVVIWFKSHDVVVYVPISTIKKMKEDGKKSVNVKDINSDYNIKTIPSEKIRVFLKSDYTKLQYLQEGE